MISYQGLLTQSGAPVPDGLYNVTVSFYTDPDGANRVWQGTYSIQTVSGVFSVLLGSGASLFPSAAIFNQTLWVGVAFNGGAEMRPLAMLASAPSALAIPNGSVTAAKMGTNYLAGIAVNGNLVTGKGAVLNLAGGDNTRLQYDSLSNSVIVNVDGIAAGTGQAAGDTSAGSSRSWANKGGGARTMNTGDPVKEGTTYNGGHLTKWESQSGGSDYITATNITDNGTTVTTSDQYINISGTNPAYQLGGSTVLDDYGTANIFAGVGAGGSSTLTGQNNTAIGYLALNQLSGQNDNTAVGYRALSNIATNDAENTAIGTSALQNGNSSNSTAIGYESFANGGGNYTTMVGCTAGWDGGGTGNTGVGYQALYNPGSDYNTGVGTDAAVGTGVSDATAIGSFATASANNSTAIGYDATENSSNSIQLGNTAITAVTTAGTIQTGTTSAGTTGELIFNDGTANGYTTSFSIGSQSSSYPHISYTLPTSSPAGTTYLSNNGSGALSWSAGSGVTSVTASYPLSASGYPTTNISLSGVVDVSHGGTGQNTLAQYSVLVGEGTGAIDAVSGTSGQVLIAQSSADPAFKTLNGDATIDNTGAVQVNGVQSGAGNSIVTAINASSSQSVIDVAHGGTGSIYFNGNGVLFGTGYGGVQSTGASTAAGSILQTTVAGGAPSWLATLGLANGGTGADGSNVNANYVFIGPASGAPGNATFRALTTADIPDLSGEYIDNSTSVQASANFNISGSGVIGATLSVVGMATLGNSSTAGVLAVNDGFGNTTSFTPGNQGTTSISYILPATLGTQTQYLSLTGVNNGIGTLSWVTGNPQLGVMTDQTLQGTGLAGALLGINLDNANTWTNTVTIAPSQPSGHNVTSLVVKEQTVGLPGPDIMVVENNAAINCLRVDKVGNVEIGNYNTNSMPPLDSHILSGGTHDQIVTVPGGSVPLPNPNLPANVPPGPSTLLANDVCGLVGFTASGTIGDQIAILTTGDYSGGSDVVVVVSAYDQWSSPLAPYAKYSSSVPGQPAGTPGIIIGVGIAPPQGMAMYYEYHVFHLQ